MNNDFEFDKAVYKSSVYLLFRGADGTEIGIDNNKIHQILTNSIFKSYEKTTLIELKEGGYLFCGKIKEEDYSSDENSAVIYKDNCFIPPKKIDFKCLTNVKLLKFKVPITKIKMDDDFRASIKMSFNRDSFAHMASLERDIDGLYSHLEKKILK